MKTKILNPIVRTLAALLAAAPLMAACKDTVPSVIWYEGEMVHRIVICDAASLAGKWELWFSQFPRDMEVLGGSGAEIEHVQANTYRIVPSAGAEPSDTIAVIYRSAPLKRHSWAPEGFTLVQDGRKTRLPVRYEFLPLPPADPSWSEANNLENVVPVGEEAMIPALKKVGRLDGTTVLEDADAVCVTLREAPHPAGWYRITINGTVNVEASDEDGAFYAGITLENLKRAARGKAVGNAVIEDWPDFAFRGAMIDVARNFTIKDNLLRLIDILAHYKINVLHLHLSDDEGWRLAVDGIAELTDVGAVHDIPADGCESRGLQPSYDGNAFPDSDALSNGFYSKADFIGILRYAAERRIRVIPEFDMPAHSRAAIKSMIAYEKRTGDSSMRLHDPADESKYKSAQGYTDNVLCVASEGVYKFVETVVDYVRGLYAEAGVELVSIHLGGDEVPRGAWTASPLCRKFMEENGMTSARQLRSYFICRICDIVQTRGLRLSGWEEIACNITDEAAARLHKVLYSANCWNTVPSWGGDEIPYRLANAGYGVVLSNVMNTYADEAYSPDKREPGHSWACFLDEKKSFALQPFDIYKSVRKPDGSFYDDRRKEKLRHPENILGVQVQMFTETVRSFDDLTYDMFPKILGAFERSWNARPEWESTGDFNEDYRRFYSVIVHREMPYFDSLGINYRKGVRTDSAF